MKKIFAIGLIFLAISCAVKPYKISDKSYRKQIKVFKETISKTDTIGLGNNKNSQWISTINFNLRKPNFIIIHHTAQDSLAQTIKTFTMTKTQVSAHYVIGDDGKVVQMLNDYLRAWHGGAASWGRNTDINSCSIGIELDNNGVEPFSESQINSLLLLLKRLKKAYNIPAQNIIGHSDIAPSRKSDPSVLFPWKKLAENGYGLYADENLVEVPSGFDAEMGLKIIGYYTKDLKSAVKAFKRHFMTTNIETDEIDNATLKTIYCIYLKLL